MLEDRLVPSGTEFVSTNPNDWPMYNHDAAGTRYNSGETELSSDTVGRLEVKWSLPTEGPIAGTPAVVDNTVFAVDGLGWVYAVNRNGDELWRTYLEDPPIENPPPFFITPRVSASVLVTNNSVIVGDLRGFIHGLDRSTGDERWHIRPNDDDAAAIFGSPTMVGNNVAIGIASLTELYAFDPNYVTDFRGSVVLFDPEDGAVLWQTYAISAADQASGASGAAVWSTPTYDPGSEILYINTGNNYSEPTTGTSDAFMALDAHDGSIKWISQTTAFDSWTLRDLPEDLINHPDFGYGDSPQIYTIGGRKIVGAGEKSGFYNALDADTGQIIRALPVVPGGMLGGLMPDSAVANGVVFANGVDWPAPFDGGAPRGGSLTAIFGDASGVKWSFDEDGDLDNGHEGTVAPNLSGVAVANGVVYFQSLNGILYALDAGTGKELAWVLTEGQTSGPAISHGQIYLGRGDVMTPYFNPLQDLGTGSILALGLAPELPAARPFKGNMSGQFQVTPTTEDPMVLTATGTASGHATYLGNFTKVTNDVIDLRTGLIYGTFTITAANGDTLTGSYVGRIIPGPIDANGVQQVTLKFTETITGGTGRFAKARGTFVATSKVILNLVTGEGIYQEAFEGEMSFSDHQKPISAHRA
jgi:outer membrane protein assembly factor BamB